MAGPYKTAILIAQLATLGNNADFSKRPDARNIDGKVCHFRGQYTLLGTEAATEILQIGNLPKGARVLPSISKVTPSADPGTALVVDIGTLRDPDAFADGLVLTAGERAFFDTPVAPAAALDDLAIGEGALLPTTPTDETNNLVMLTFMTATVLTAGVKLNFDIYFAIP